MTSKDDEKPIMIATQKEMEEAHLPLEWRDFCAHLLIPLNKCRNKNNYLPWKCENERHVYEKCQYDEMRLAEKRKKEEEQKKQSNNV
ncbi:NADH-ubiquinone oxidoreductase [Gigaspora rosea]|uniref:NADH dehydrogenase [ubiquinone] 1 beta subcomplex subunit 7 n=1 Tax=Gigaspora rosea TaxID=44941 RepID=A0A397UPN2_9GLOM|nr:NADH-ubiquinone oxidoreductase [Gigaspora rosea]